MPQTRNWGLSIQGNDDGSVDQECESHFEPERLITGVAKGGGQSLNIQVLKQLVHIWVIQVYFSIPLKPKFESKIEDSMMSF